MPTISGLSSGMDTDAIVDKLVEVESMPIKRLENEIRQRQEEKEAWESIRASLQKLDSSSQGLYSFRAPFNTKICLSSAEHIAIAEANQYAESLRHEMIVMQLATRHKIASDSIAKDQKIEKGEFTIKIGDKQRIIYFPGGKISDLHSVLSDKGNAIVSTSLIKENEENFVITIESKEFGSANNIELIDEMGILKAIGFRIIEKKEQEKWQAPIDKFAAGEGLQAGHYYNSGNGIVNETYWFWSPGEKADFVQEINNHNQEILSRNQGQEDPPAANLEPSAGNNINDESVAALLTLKGENHVGFQVNNYQIDANSYLSVSYKPDIIPERLPDDDQQKEENQGPRQVAIQDESQLNVGGVMLEGESFLRQEADFLSVRESTLGRDIFEPDKNVDPSGTGAEDINLQPIKGKIRLIFSDGSHQDFVYQAAAGQTPGQSWMQMKESLIPHSGKNLQSVEVIHSSGIVSIANIFIEPPETQNTFQYQNELSSAQDAIIRYGGVDITRPYNRNLDDIIKGLTIHLLSADSQQSVVLQVDVAIDKAKEAISEWIDRYNEFMDLANQYQQIAIESEVGKHGRQKQNSGVLAGDQTLNRLLDDLKRIASDAYPNSKDKNLRVFYQIGISTGRIGSSASQVRSGKLSVIDQGVLEKQLSENAPAVAEFFGSDTSGDNKTDSGMAFAMSNYVSNYTQSGRYGLINTKIRLAEDRIKQTEEAIKKHEQHIASYKERLRRSFQAMEKGLSQSKSEEQWLQNQLGNMGGGNKK